MKTYIIIKAIVIDILSIGCVYLAYLCITQPELLANWIKVVRSGFAG